MKQINSRRILFSNKEVLEALREHGHTIPQGRIVNVRIIECPTYRPEIKSSLFWDLKITIEE